MSAGEKKFENRSAFSKS